jgi:hypothetical protein
MHLIALIVDLVGWLIFLFASTPAQEGVGLAIVVVSVFVAHVVLVLERRELERLGEVEAATVNAEQMLTQILRVANASGQRTGNAVSAAALAVLLGGRLVWDKMGASVVAGSPAAVSAAAPASAPGVPAPPQAASNTSADAAALPSEIRGDFRFAGGSGGCKDGAVLTVTRTRISVDGCGPSGLDLSVPVRSVNVDGPLYLIETDGGDRWLLKSKAVGTLSVVEPARWAGVWAR